MNVNNCRRALLPVALLLALSLPAQTRNGYPEADVRYGASIFQSQCIGCHGPMGNLIPGVNLRENVFKRITSDDGIRATLATGVPGTEMPAFKFDAAELAGIVAYIRNMRDFDVGAAALGDAARGRVLYDKSGCGGCHRINGQGPRLAPDLSDVGSQRTPDALQLELVDPTKAMRPLNRSVRAVTRDGKVITGRRLNEDTYTVQLMDGNERLVSLDKASLKDYVVIPTSPMPSYKDKLSPQEQADLVAYLLSLKGLK